MNNVLLTIIGFSIIFLATTSGAFVVFFFKNEISAKVNSACLGFAAGIMTAASVWSLLLPAIDGAKNYGDLAFLPAVAGFLIGGGFIVVLGKLVPEFKGDYPEDYSKRIKTFIAITVHNVPEGLAVGFAFGAAAVIGAQEAYLSALGLAVGIAIQNFPEGAAVSLPLKRGVGKKKAFFLGTLSGVVEPIAAVIGYFLAAYLTPMQPWLLSFAAGAMIFVVAEDLIPEAISGSAAFGTWGVMLGFAIMMALDVALG